MIDVKRDKGKTVIQFGNSRIVSDRINRFRYNELRKAAESFRRLLVKALTQGKR